MAELDTFNQDLFFEAFSSYLSADVIDDYDAHTIANQTRACIARLKQDGMNLQELRAFLVEVQRSPDRRVILQFNVAGNTEWFEDMEVFRSILEFLVLAIDQFSFE